MGAAPGKPTVKLAGGRKNPQEEPFTQMISNRLNTQNQGRGYTGGTNRLEPPRPTNNRGSF